MGAFGTSINSSSTANVMLLTWQSLERSTGPAHTGDKGILVGIESVNGLEHQHGVLAGFSLDQRHGGSQCDCRPAAQLINDPTVGRYAPKAIRPPVVWRSLGVTRSRQSAAHPITPCRSVPGSSPHQGSLAAAAGRRIGHNGLRVAVGNNYREFFFGAGY